MQKMIFSAVALVAFSFAGMANEVETEKKIEKVTQNMHVPYLHCVVEYILVYNELVDVFGEDEARENASAYMTFCVQNTKY